MSTTDRDRMAIERALQELRAGRPVLVTDDEDRENEGDAILAAQTLTDDWMGWTIRHTSGYLCAPVTEEIADRLDLPLMVPDSADRFRTAYTVSVDATRGVTTGISAVDRATTARTLADPDSSPRDLTRPGHLIRCAPATGSVGTPWSHRGRRRPVPACRTGAGGGDRRTCPRRRVHDAA